MFIMLPCSQRALILVLEHVGNFGVRLPPGCSRQGVSVHCMCVQMLSLYATGWPVFPKCMQLVCYAAIVGCSVGVMLCRCKRLSLSRVWFLCATVQISVRHNYVSDHQVSYRSLFLHEICGILWLTLWRCWLHSCRMFILLVEYGLVHNV